LLNSVHRKQGDQARISSKVIRGTSKNCDVNKPFVILCQNYIFIHTSEALITLSC